MPNIEINNHHMIIVALVLVVFIIYQIYKQSNDITSLKKKIRSMGNPVHSVDNDDIAVVQTEHQKEYDVDSYMDPST